MPSDTFPRRKALTYVACASIIALGIPAGTFAAVAGSNMFITDASSGYRAHVNRAGQLLVNNTGSSVKVSGSVSTAPIGSSFTQTCSAPTTTNQVACNLSPAVPAGKTFNVRQINFLVQVPSGDVATTAAISGSVPGGGFTSFYLPLVSTGTAGSYSNFAASTQVDINLTSTNADTGFMSSTSSSGTSWLHVTVTGYLH